MTGGGGGVDDAQIKKLMKKLQDDMEQNTVSINKNFNLFKERVAQKDQLQEAVDTLNKLEERMKIAETVGEKASGDLKTQGRKLFDVA